MEGYQAEVLALGVALLLPAVGAAWKAAGWRSDTYVRWSSDLDLTLAALDERATAVLREIHIHTTKLLGEPDTGFDPTRVVTDPSDLSVFVAKFLKIVHRRRGLRANVQWLLRLGPILFISSVVYGLGVLLAALYYADLVVNELVSAIGLSFASIGAIGMFAVFAAYVVLQSRISSAQVLSSKALDNA